MKTFSEYVLAEKKKKEPDPVKEIEKDTKPVTKKPEAPVEDVKMDTTKLELKITTGKEESPKMAMKIVKNETTFSENEVEALKKILENTTLQKFTSDTTLVTVYRAEKNFIYIPDSSKSVYMVLMKYGKKVTGYFDARKNVSQDINMQVGSSDDGTPDIVCMGINATFEFSADDLKDIEFVSKKLSTAFLEFYNATEWSDTDDESFADWLKGKTAQDEVNYGEGQKFTLGGYLMESSFGDNLAETIRAVYSKLPLEEAKKFYLALQKIIAEYSFVNREEMNEPVEDTPTLGNDDVRKDGEDNVEVSKDAL